MNISKKAGKWISFLLAFVMVLGMMSTAAFAASAPVALTATTTTGDDALDLNWRDIGEGFYELSIDVDVLGSDTITLTGDGATFALDSGSGIALEDSVITVSEDDPNTTGVLGTITVTHGGNTFDMYVMFSTAVEITAGENGSVILTMEHDGGETANPDKTGHEFGAEESGRYLFDYGDVLVIAVKPDVGYELDTDLSDFDEFNVADGYNETLRPYDSEFDAAAFDAEDLVDSTDEEFEGYTFYTLAAAGGTQVVEIAFAEISSDGGDSQAPSLSSGSVNRTSDTEATIDFTTNEAGTAYYTVVEANAQAPEKGAVTTSIGAVDAEAVSGKAVTLTAGAKDIYVVVKDAAGNISEPLKIAAAAYNASDPPVLSGGSVNRTSDTEATISFNTDKSGTAYYLVAATGTNSDADAVKAADQSLGAVTAGVVSNKAVELTAGAQDIYVVVNNSNGDSNVLTIAAAAYVPSDTYAVTVTGSYASPTGAGDYAEDATVTIYAGSRSNYRFNGWTVNSGGVTLANANSAITTFTMPANAVSVTANWTYVGGSSSSGGSSSGGGSNWTPSSDDDDDDDDYSYSGGGSSSRTTTTTSASRSSNVSSDGSVSATTIASQAATALNGAGAAIVQTKNATSISASTIQSLASAANRAQESLVLHADTLSADGKTVDGRLYVNPAELTGLTADLKLGVSTSEAKTGAVTELFERWFTNDVVVVRCEQQGSFGARLRIAAKADLSGLNTSTLYFYSYNRATNSYQQIANPAYFVDANGYLHFYTELAGDIIVTDSPLVKS